MQQTLASPAKIIQALLVADGWGVMPGIFQVVPDQSLLVDPPQIFTEAVPDDVNYLIYCRNVAGRSFGHDQDTGRIQSHKGVSIMVRHPNEDGYTLAEGVFDFLSTITFQSVTIDCYSYNIQSVYPTVPHPIDMGEEESKSRLRWVMDFCVAMQEPPRTLIEE